ncbi:hypothetical protein E4U13_007719 [Claviceps humidiphila]|uniref:Uncharacterized protein n=1 Tax=Claviceps humidiphila TaxID=1294629 RepID=A0A9P7Q9P4_9HYPO|nr:hypothetical protein E4U13_007719 [Claviceps humidiphila]
MAEELLATFSCTEASREVEQFAEAGGFIIPPYVPGSGSCPDLSHHYSPAVSKTDQQQAWISLFRSDSTFRQSIQNLYASYHDQFIALLPNAPRPILFIPEDEMKALESPSSSFPGPTPPPRATGFQFIVKAPEPSSNDEYDSEPPSDECDSEKGSPSTALSPGQSNEDVPPMVSVGAAENSIKIYHQYKNSELQVSPCPQQVVRGVDADSDAYIKDTSALFPFFHTDIAARDIETGYFTYDADGLPVSHDRIFKARERTRRITVDIKRDDVPEREASLWYDTWEYQPKSWGPENKFVYTEDAQLLLRNYTTQDILYYLKKCPRRYALWVQRVPSQSNKRTLDRSGKQSMEDKCCRWDGCPIEGRAVTGMIRVAFDEFPLQTSQGIKDPFKVAMIMHLWCFEQFLDPVLYLRNGRMHFDTRTFATPLQHDLESELDLSLTGNLGRAEKKNPFSIRLGDGKKSEDVGKVLEMARDPWLERNPMPVAELPRDYEDSLSYAITSWRDQNKTKSKIRQGILRHGKETTTQRLADEPECLRFYGTAIQKHLGSLLGYKAALDNEKASKSWKMLPSPSNEAVEFGNIQPQQTGGRTRRLSVIEEDIYDDERPSKRARIN